MVCQYSDYLQRALARKAKVFAKENGPIRKKIGNPDLLILFTNTVSHKMVLGSSTGSKVQQHPGSADPYKQCSCVKGRAERVLRIRVWQTEIL